MESGSISTVSRDDNTVMSSEDSSCPDDESELELGLGLSLGGVGFKMHHHVHSSVSSSSSSSLRRANVTAGTKRTADSVASIANGSSQVVGWPPIRAYRMNSMVSQAKAPITEGFNSTTENRKKETSIVENSSIGGYHNSGKTKLGKSLFVKVNMDGIPIGRKVDLNANKSYEKLAKTLEEMFLETTPSVNPAGSTALLRDMMNKMERPSKLLDGSSDFVLAYEDKKGDWMAGLRGQERRLDARWRCSLGCPRNCIEDRKLSTLNIPHDVTRVWFRMFLSSVKRLKIMRKSEATGLAPRLQEWNQRQRRKST